MDLAQLRYFLAVAECGSFTVAAKKCNVSQPALSQQVAKLEKEFRASLFDRQGRHVSLTRLGHTLRDRAGEILRAVEDTQKQMLDDGRYGRLVFATSTTVGPYLSAKLLQHVGREFGESELIFFEQPVAQLVRSCEKGEIDLGLIPYPSCCGRDLVTEPLFEEEIKIGISRSHRLSNLSSISLADLNGEKIVLLNEDHHLSNVIQDVLAEQHVEAKVSAQVESFALLNYLVSLNHGIGFFPSSAIPKQINKNVCFLPIEGKPMTRSLALCWNGRRYQTQLMTNFVKALQEFSFVDLKPYDGTLFSDQDSQVEQNGVAKPKNSRALAVPAVLK